MFNGVSVYATPYISHLKESSLLAKILRRILNVLRRMRFIQKIVKEGKYNLVFIKDGEVFDGLLATYIKRRYKIPFVFYLSSSLEQNWEIFKIDSLKPKFLYYLIAKFTTLVKMHTMHKADLILPTTKWCGEELAKKGIPISKMMPYPESADIAAFANKDGRNIRGKYNLGNSKVVVYVGTISKARYLSTLIQAFSRVRKERGNAKLLMVGDGTDRGNLERLAEELGMRSEIIFTGQVSHLEVPDFVAAADIGISPVPPLSFYKVNSVTKMFEYMAGGKPVVANEEILEQKEVLEQSGGGILVPFTPEAFADAIIELLDNLERATEMGRRGREWVVNNRSYEIMARQIEERYLEVLKTHRVNNYEV